MPRISLTLMPAVLVASVLAGCSSTKDDPTAKWTPDRIYTEARDEMFKMTDSSWAPWYAARSEDKKRVRLNVINHLLSQVPYEEIKAEKVSLPKRKIGLYKAADYPFKFVPDCVPAKTDSAKKDKKAK